MELDSHDGECNESNPPYNEGIFREKVAAEDVVQGAPYHRGDEEQDKEGIPPLPGPAGNRADQQGHISQRGNQGKQRIYILRWELLVPACQLSSVTIVRKPR